MPIDYRQIYEKIREIGAGSRERKKTLEERRVQAREMLRTYADQLDVLRSKVESAKTADANLRCAMPANESLTSHSLPAASTQNATLIAADGSQIDPDRHAALLFSLINVGVIVFRSGSNLAPEVFSFADLKYGEELYSETGSLKSQDLVALGRDLAERKILLDLTTKYPAPVIALTDGPVEIWGAQGSNQQAYYRTRELHLSILSQLQTKGAIVAGYIDKPAADLVSQLLELTLIPEPEMKEVRRKHPLRGVTDLWLFGEPGNPLLKSGERSAVFILQSGSRTHYEGSLEIRFFYLNVGNELHPWIVRIELPAWVAEDKNMLDLLHQALLEQCKIMGVRPYPYVLQRAHETAVVKFDEREQVEQLLQLELNKNDEEIGVVSYKQSGKNLEGRARSK
jgi:NurA domain